MRDEECTMSLHRAVASIKSDDERKALLQAWATMNARGVLEQGSILERNTRKAFSIA